MKKAFITGITGQDGAYLSRFLARKGYEVHGMRRRASSNNLSRLEYLFGHEPELQQRLHLHYGDLTDSSNLNRLIDKLQPTEIYNLAAQSHVHVSFETPEYTANADAVGPLRILEAVRNLDMTKDVKFYQASTSELYGKIQSEVQNESTPFYPRSPYGVAKLYAYWITVNYREAYDIFASNGVLFNHESPLRGETFVTKKITTALARIVHDQQEVLHLGNLSSERDWGHASDFVEAQWRILQHSKPDDFVVATGKKFSIRHLINVVCSAMGLELEFRGSGIDEVGVIVGIDKAMFEARVGRAASSTLLHREIVKVDPFYFRPTEVDVLLGDCSKIERELGWKPTISFEEMINEMVAYDLEAVKKEGLLK